MVQNGLKNAKLLPTSYAVAAVCSTGPLFFATSHSLRVNIHLSSSPVSFFAFLRARCTSSVLLRVTSYILKTVAVKGNHFSVSSIFLRSFRKVGILSVLIYVPVLSWLLKWLSVMRNVRKIRRYIYETLMNYKRRDTKIAFCHKGSYLLMNVRRHE